MDKALKILEKVVPEAIKNLQDRLDILQTIYKNQPIGRRKLSTILGKSERTIRTEIDVLKDINLVEVVSRGIHLTENGETVLKSVKLKDNTLTMLEERIKELFHIETCKVVPGSIDDIQGAERCFQSFGQALTSLLDEKLPLGNNTIAVTGGTTLSQVVKYVDDIVSQYRNFDIVSARGSGTGSPLIQSTMIGHLLSTSISGNNYTLSVPEQISSELYEPLSKEPTVVSVLERLYSANCLLYSVGDAQTMLERRGVSTEDKNTITRENAVGEVLGVFFNENGQIVHRVARIGLKLEDLQKVPLEILIVAGTTKVKALSAYMEIASSKTNLIIDEALAKLVLKEHKI